MLIWMLMWAWHSMTKDSSLHFNVTAFVSAGIRMSTSMAQKQKIVKCNPIRVDPEVPAGPNANIGFSSSLPFASIYTLIAWTTRLRMHGLSDTSCEKNPKGWDFWTEFGAAIPGASSSFRKIWLVIKSKRHALGTQGCQIFMIFQYFPITTVSHPLTIPWSAHQVALSDMELRLNASAKKTRVTRTASGSRFRR